MRIIMTQTWDAIKQLVNVAINDALPLKAARRDTSTKLKSFGSFESELQTNQMSFHLDSTWWAPRDVNGA